MAKYYWISGLLGLVFLASCATTNTKKAAKEQGATVFEAQYYQDLEKNIVRLHHLMQGTFTAHAKTKEEKMTTWKVSEGDSVILCNVPLGEVAKHGYWIFSYEFMTSLPDEPLYTSIKKLVQIDRDTVDVYYYESKTPLDVTLADVLDNERLTALIDFDQLVKRDKWVRYVRQSSAHFVGQSKVYVDPDRNCLRQHTYDISPTLYQVNTNFYDKENTKRLDIKKRPNLLVRRSIEERTLSKIATKG